MNIERIRSFDDQRPVRPFTIHTASVESDTVKQPETMAIDAAEEVGFLLPDRGQVAMIDMSSITEITQDFRKQETTASE